MDTNELTLHIAMRLQQESGNLTHAIEVVREDVSNWRDDGVVVPFQVLHAAWIEVLRMQGVQKS